MERPQGEERVINDWCDNCFSVSSPVVVTTPYCVHKFCAKCILYLWSRQRLREPCVCPIDGVKMPWLRPARRYVPEEITSLVALYNRFLHPKYPVDMTQAKFHCNMSWLHGVETAICVAGLIAYCIKAR